MIHIYFNDHVHVVRYDMGIKDHERLDFDSFMMLANLRALWAERGLR